MAPNADTIWRNYETAGVPDSGPWKPPKSDIREWGTRLEGFINASDVNSRLVFTSRASLFAALNHAANTSAWVMGDSVTAYNGVYRKIGASSSGSWSRVGDLPYSLINASNVGDGTANALVASTSIPVTESALVILEVAVANTASPVSVAFNGDNALTIKTNSGNDVAVGGLVAGMRLLGTKAGTIFRLASDQASAAIMAAAEGYAGEAADYAALARNDIVVNSLVGDGATIDFALTVDPGHKNNVVVNMGGAFQFRSSYALVYPGAVPTLRFVEAPPDTIAFEVAMGFRVEIETPATGSVGTDALADDAVTADKLSTADLPAIRAKLAAGSPSGHIFGLTISNNGADAANDLDIAAGDCSSDAASPLLMALASTITKRADAAWSVGSGNGGLDAGSISNGMYHIFVIMRSDTGVVDVLYSSSISAPTMPTNYTHKRRIGSRARAGGVWLAFTQIGDEVVYGASVLDVSITTLPASAISVALTVPTGVPVKALVTVQLHILSNAYSVLVSSLLAADEAPSVTNRTVAALSNVNEADTNDIQIMTNASGQIRYRGSSASGVTNFSIRTRGFIDIRGRLA